MAKLVSSASMIRISKQALTSKIEAYGLFVYIKIELYGFTAIVLYCHITLLFTFLGAYPQMF